MARVKCKKLSVLFLLLCSAPLCVNSASTKANAQSSSESSKVNSFLKGGIEKHQHGDDAGADSDFRQALRLDSANANAHYNLAVVEEARGETGPALKEYREVLRVHPNDQSAISAIHELESSTGNGSAFQERPILKGDAGQGSLLPSADAFATLPNYPPLAPARGGSLNSSRFNNSVQLKTEHNPQTTNLAVATEQNNTGGTMHALRSFGASFIRASMMYGRPIDTCACPIFRF